MITEENEILDYETCKLLREFGFDDPCEYLYRTAVRHNGVDISYDDEMDLKSEGREDEIEYVEGGRITKTYNRNSFGIMGECSCVSAPDILTTMRWFRKEKGLNITADYNGGTHKWRWSVTDCSTGDPRPYDGFADGYEEAAKDAILCLCQNVLKQEQCHTSL